MKHTGKCPKCESAKLICVPGHTGSFGSGNNVRVGVVKWFTIPVARYVCASCGYSEEWIEAPSDVRKLQETYGLRED